MFAHTDFEEATDVVVIGGGLAGLTTATYLAQAGLSVTLFEKAAKVGGRAATQSYGDGFLLNRGIHAFYSGGTADEVLTELDVKYTGTTPRDVFELRQGKFYVAPISLGSLLRTKLLTWKEKFELMGLFSKLSRLKPEDFAYMSVKEWVNRSLRSKGARQFMLSFAPTAVYTSNLDLVSAQVIIEKSKLTLKHPIIYLDGGWQSLADGLAAKAARAGVRIINNVFIEAVEYREGQIEAVKLRDGQQVRAKAVVIATTPQAAAKLVDYPALQKIVERLVPGQIACLDVALKSLPNTLHPVVLNEDKSIFLSTQSLYAKIAPEGGGVISLFKQLDPQNPSNPRDDEGELESVLDIVQPGWRDRVVTRNFLPRMDGVSMLPSAKEGGYKSRPDYRVPGLNNLYLAGDWIGPEGFLVDASFASARHVAKLLLQNLPTGADKAVNEKSKVTR